jgi:ABC-type branched-subunit amino acid transport system substrate-binding protein
MSNTTKLITAAIALVLIALGTTGLSGGENTSNETNKSIKIGVIIPLSGNSAYWGESTQAGVQMASKELQTEGLNIEFVTEDGKIDSTTAVNAAQKLVNIDNVDAIYSEFNPAAVSVSSFLENRDVFHMYAASVVSPLESNPDMYKTYLDYRESCKEMATVLQSEGVERVGLMKVSLEFGNLCLEGIEAVYSDNVVVKSFDSGANDLRTQITQLSNSDAETIVVPALKPDTKLFVRQSQQLGINTNFAILKETVDSSMVQDYSDHLENSYVFGLPTVADDFRQKINSEYDTPVGDLQAAALGYLHTKQIANAMSECENASKECVADQVSQAQPDDIIGFKGFDGQIAVFDTVVKKFSNGKFKKVSGN